VLIQIYAVAIDDVDLNALGSKGKGDVGKWVPGRSFVGRCLSVGVEEKEIVRGDIVLGLVDVRKVSDFAFLPSDLWTDGAGDVHRAEFSLNTYSATVVAWQELRILRLWLSSKWLCFHFKVSPLPEPSGHI